MAGALTLAASPAYAGPPFSTDDPEPTEKGHWEIYGPLVDMEGVGSSFSGSVGVEINYGAADNLQLTLGLPTGFSHDRTGWQWGAGDVEVSAKYRIIDDKESGVQVALFPGLSLPTGTNGQSAGKVTALLPIWVQKDSGNWSLFGGGGYAINPGAGNRDYWTGGIAVSRKMNDRLLIGVEADRQGPDQVDGRAKTSLGLGTIFNLNQKVRLLASAGPTFDDGGGAANYHVFAAVGFDF